MVISFVTGPNLAFDIRFIRMDFLNISTVHHPSRHKPNSSKDVMRNQTEVQNKWNDAVSSVFNKSFTVNKITNNKQQERP